MSDEDMRWRFSQADKKGVRSPVDFGGHSLSEIEAVLVRIPLREADMVRMYYFHNKEQKDIGQIFNVSQGDVFYRLNRAIKRIKFIMALPSVTQEQMKLDLGPILEDDLHLMIMWGLYETTSQTEVALRAGMTQGKVRYRFLKCLKKIKQCALVEDKYQVYVTIFDMVAKNFNAIRELSTQDRWKSKFKGEKR